MFFEFVSINIPPPGEGDKEKPNIKKMNNKTQKESLKRLKIIKGHLEKVIRMIEEDKYCIDVLHQSLAVQSALKKVDSLILSQHLKKCVSKAMKKGNSRKEKIIEELLEVYKFSNK